MRAPLIPTLLMVLATSFGGVAYAIDSASDLAVQLSIVALQANDNLGSPSFATTMVVNGLTIPVTVTRDANGKLIIDPVVDAKGKIAAVDARGNAVSIDAAAMPTEFSLVITTNPAGAVVVKSMTITSVTGASVTLSALPVAAGAEASFVVTAGDTTVLAGVVDAASAPVATQAQQQAVAQAQSDDSTTVGVVQGDVELAKKPDVSPEFVPPAIVVQQEATNQTVSGNAAENPSPSTP